MPREGVATYRRLVESMRGLHAQGVDYPARMASRCRQRGLSPWISLRMNDVHNNDILDHPFHGQFWVEHPHLFRKGATGYFANALDYAHPEVRDLYLALIRETLDRYDIDGLELDFLREPYLFSPGKEAEGAPLLTAWLRGVRRLVQETAARRGHPVRLGVRVPSRPETAKALGLDTIAWAREGLVDLVVPAPRWATLEFDMPIAEWRRLLRPFPKVMLAGGLEILYRPHPGAKPASVSPEHAYAAASAVWQAGAHAVYLFNYFQDGSWPPETYRKVLMTLGSPERLSEAPRWHAVTYRDIVGPDEEYRPPLPAVGRTVRFDVPVSPAPGRDWPVRVILGLEDAPEPPAIRVNGEEGVLEKAEPHEAVYSVPGVAFEGRARAEISLRAGQPVRVVKVEVRVTPPEAATVERKR
ncbi:MAG TPA: family 10 glycosylhydrolase [Armatimonadetes bacterium]|nr:family 10 glycosylhydrolase [Armatimonadota bacterium]